MGVDPSMGGRMQLAPARRRSLPVRLGVALAVVLMVGICAPAAFATVTGPLSWAPPVSVDPDNALEAVSCPAAWMCVAVDNGGNVVTSTDPGGGADRWNVAHIDSDTVADASATLTDVSCPSVSLCVAVDNVGALFSSTDPTAGASSWTLADRIPVTGFLAVSCPSVALCVAVDQSGDAVTSTDPGAGAGAWHTAQLIPPGCVARVCGESLTAVSCPSVSFCVASAWNGDVLTSTDPTGGAGAWTAAHVDTSVLDIPPPSGSPASISFISCPSTSLCVATDQAGNVLASQDPAGGPAAWSVTVPPSAAPAGSGIAARMPLACPSVSFCVVLGDPGNVLEATPGELATTATPLGGAPWSVVNVGSPGLIGVSCPSAMFCAVVGAAGDVTIGRVQLLSPAAIAGLLQRALAASGAPSLGYLRRVRGFTLPFKAPSAGTVLLRWLVAPATGHAHGATELLAEGQAHYATAATATVDLSLTGVAGPLLRHAGHLPVTAEVVFTPVDGPPVEATCVFTLRR